MTAAIQTVTPTVAVNNIHTVTVVTTMEVITTVQIILGTAAEDIAFL